MESPEWQIARQLIREHGWNTTCGQLLNPGLELWLPADHSAVVGFRTEKGRRVVAGAPVCAPQRLETIVAQFESVAGEPVCYFGAEDRMCRLAKQDGGRSLVVLGAQPVWSPENFLREISTSESLRAQLARSRNKGVTVHEIGEVDASLREKLEGVLGQWLETRGLPPLHFLVEPRTLDRLGDRRLFVARRDGDVCGFVVLSPIPARRGYLTEHFVRGRQAPNGTVELALAHAVSVVASEGAEFLTMGIVPLSRHIGSQSNPPWLNGVAAWARAHAKRFYNFDGLDHFKAKFKPEKWDPVYLVGPQAEFDLRTLYAVVSAFTEGHPIRALIGGFGRALRSETRWLLAKS